MKAFRPRRPSPLHDQVTGWLFRRKGQELTDTLLDDFGVFFWRKSQEHDLILMREMVKERHAHT